MSTGQKYPKCKYHQTETITNYCSQTGCFTQLCAACICDHTEAHNANNTKPKYQLLKQVYTNTNNNLVKLKGLIVEQKNRMSVMVERINRQKEEGYHILKQAREEIIQLVYRTFDEIEENYTKYTEEQKQKTRFFTPSRLNYLYSELNNYSLEIYNKGQELTCTNGGVNVKIIKSINTDFIPNIQKNVDDIDREMTQQEKFGVGLTYRYGNLEEVVSVIKKLFTTSVSYSLPNSTNPRPARSLSKQRQSPININIRAMNPLATTRQNSMRKSNTFIKTGGIQGSKPYRIDENRYGLGNTAKENYYVMGKGTGTEQFKIFSNTYS